MTGQRGATEPVNELSYDQIHIVPARLIVYSQDGYSGCVSWRIHDGIREVEIQGHQGALSGNRRVHHGAIGGTGKRLVTNGVDVMTGFLELIPPALPKILIELKLHATSMKRPTVTWAP